LYIHGRAENKTPRAVSPQKKVRRKKTEDRCEYSSDDEVSNRVSNPEIKND
jgi:hypothetical protein